MGWGRIIRMMQDFGADWTETDGASPVDPIDHPSLRAMSLRELADLPIDAPVASCAAEVCGSPAPVQPTRRSTVRSVRDLRAIAARHGPRSPHPA